MSVGKGRGVGKRISYRWDCPASDDRVQFLYEPSACVDNKQIKQTNPGGKHELSRYITYSDSEDSDDSDRPSDNDSDDWLHAGKSTRDRRQVCNIVRHTP